jgi:ABC-2 type transport system permease protein
MSTPEPAIEIASVESSPTITQRPPVLRTLIRRELWEHRALWIAPLSVAALLLVGATIGKMNFDFGEATLPEQRRAVFAAIMAVSSIPLFTTLGIMTWIYAGDCLYAERKDRSLLFWKSMPVSDIVTVLSKLLMVLVLAPLAVYLLSALVTLLISGIYVVRAPQGNGAFWDTVTWLRIQWITLELLVVSTLWYAPITAFLMLVSAWARRSVWLWVFLPPIVLIMLERMALGTHHVMDWLFYRLGAVFAHSAPSTSPTPNTNQSLNLLFANVNPLPIFSNIDLWLGLVVAALLIVVTIRIRQYRDDT